MNIDEKLSTVKYKFDKASHLNPNPDKCKLCKSKVCTKICPANVYDWTNEENSLIINYENCLECGACRIVCEKKTIDWQYPKDGITIKRG